MKLKRIIFLPLIIIGFLAVFLIDQVNTKADDNKPPYTVQLVYPSNQNPKTQNGYFDLDVTPGIRQPMGLVISNNTNEAKRLRITANSAKTNSNFEISYNGDLKTNDSSLKYDFSKFGFTPKTLKIAPNSKVSVPLDFTVPKTPFTGIILGGIAVDSVDPETTTSTQKGKTGMKLKNYLEYTIAVQLTENRTEVVEPDLKIQNINAILYSSYPAIGVVIRNTAMGLGSNVSVDSTAYLKSNPKIKAVRKTNSGNIAPNTIFTFPLMLQASKKIEAGVYHLNMTVKTDTKNFKFSRDFTVSKVDADKLNKTNPSIKKSYLWLIILVVVIVVIFIIAAFIWIFTIGLGRGRRESNAGYPQNMTKEQKKEFKKQQKLVKRRRKSK